MSDRSVIQYVNSNDLLSDAKVIIESAQKTAFAAVNVALVNRNWLLGKRIAEEELKGEGRAEYGAEIIKNLAKNLTKTYGKGFTQRNLYNCEKFYEMYPEILQSLTAKSILSWTHYTVLMQVSDPVARQWYEKEALGEMWSVRTLQRNIDSQYYYRMLSSQVKEPVKQEMESLTEKYQKDKLEFIKNPMVVEFLGLTSDTSFTESKLESSIITHLQKFIMEMGKGYAFVARQQHIHTTKQDYYIDLVFYNSLQLLSRLLIAPSQCLQSLEQCA